MTKLNSERKVRKFSNDQRLEAVLQVLNYGHSIKEIARRINACDKDVGQWVAMYQTHGIEGLFCREKKYTGDFKCKVVEYRRKNNLSLLATAVKFCIPAKSTIMKWERIYDESGATGLCNQTRGRPILTPMKSPKPQSNKKKEAISAAEPNKALLEELEHLRAENAYLKKLRALVQERISRERGNEQEPSRN